MSNGAVLEPGTAASAAGVRPLRHVLGAIRRYPQLSAGIVITTVCIALAIASLGLHSAAYTQNLFGRLEQPTYGFGHGSHFLGTDELGRDVAARILTGMRISIEISLAAVAMAGVGGVLLGMLSGYYGGWLDDVLMRVTDAVLAIPLMLLALSVVAVAGPSLINLIAVIALSQWMGFARMARGEALQVREQSFVRAARSLGARDLEIIRKNILPHLLPSAIVLATLSLSSAILLEAALSFLGLGVQPPDPSLGSMLSEGQLYMSDAPWLAIYPGVALVILVFGVNMLGDGLRRLTDPATRRSAL